MGANSKSSLKSLAILVLAAVVVGFITACSAAGPSVAPTLAAKTPAPVATATSMPQATSTVAVVSTATEPSPRAGEERVIGGAPMVYVPGGDFQMGSLQGDPDAQADEMPQHPVSLDAYWMDKYEVTNALYKMCVDANKCSPPYSKNSATHNTYYGDPTFNDYPVIYVYWRDASAFCKWAGKRLPTEAEWEISARGPDGRFFPWGNTFDPAKLNSAQGGAGDTRLVGSYPAGASPYGVQDMAGNVAEWVFDWYSRITYKYAPMINPSGTAEGQEHVLRGGAWADKPALVRTTARETEGPRLSHQRVGFRCARSAP